MKKLVSLILALAMVFALAICANATTPDHTPKDFPAVTSTGNITIKNATAGTTYTLYRILDIAHTAPGDTNVYILRDRWADFIKNNLTTFNMSLSDDYIVKVADTTYDAQLLAEAVVEYAKANNIQNDGSSKMVYSGDHTSSNQRQYGYYVMAADHDITGIQYTVFKIDSNHVEILEKNSSSASLEKFVQEDSKINDENQGWGEVNAAEIAQPVNFKIVVNLAPGTDTFVIKDEMPNFRDIQNLAVEYSGGDISEGTEYETVINPADATPAGFTITLKPDFRKAVELGNTLTITYNAKLRYTAEVGDNGNENIAKLIVGGQDGSSDKTITKTYKLKVHKIDERGYHLAGATFQLTHNNTPLHFREMAKNKYSVSKEAAGETIDKITTDADGYFEISGLDTEDEYILKEIEAPTGYILMDDETIKIATDATADAEITVTNLPGVQMPTTGGMGTTLFYVLGIVLVCGAAVLLVSKKRMSAK